MPTQTPFFHLRQRARIARTERVEPVRMQLAHIEPAVHRAGEHRDHAARAGLAHDDHRIEQVLRAVGLQ